MKNKERGVVGIDIAIAVVVLFIFVSIISILSYRVNSSNQEISLKSKALNIAVKEIERIKNEGFKTYEAMNIESDTGITNKDLGLENEDYEGLYETVIVEDYTDLAGNEDKVANIVKKITVTINYAFKGKTQEISLNTVLSKEI